MVGDLGSDKGIGRSPVTPDLYALLGVAPGASREAIGRAYRRLARASHPDVRPDDPGASARFRAITGAYEVLSDPARRASYDRAARPRRGTWPIVVSVDRPERQPEPQQTSPRLAALWVGSVRVERSPGPASENARSRFGSPTGDRPILSLILRLLTDGWRDV